MLAHANKLRGTALRTDVRRLLTKKKTGEKRGHKNEDEQQEQDEQEQKGEELEKKVWGGGGQKGEEGQDFQDRKHFLQEHCLPRLLKIYTWN